MEITPFGLRLGYYCHFSLFREASIPNTNGGFSNDHQVQIRYRRVTEVEVSDEIGTVILDSRREEHANNERHRYHTAFSLDDMTYEDKDYFSAGDNPEEAFMRKEAAKQRKAMLSQLTPVQRRRFEKYEGGMSIAEIARSEKAAFNSVKESIESAQKKLKKLL